MPMTVAELVAASLAANGITSVYCLPGVQNDPLFDAFHGLRDQLRIIHTRHEQGAAYMAAGAAMATGRSQVYCVVPGPGFLNTTAALATAGASNARVLALVGQIPSVAIGKGYGLLHEIPDQFGMLRKLTKCAHSISDGGRAHAILGEVLTSLETGRPGPVGLEVPTDVWNAPVAGHEPVARLSVRPGPAVDRNALDLAVGLIERSKRPLIVVGGGAQSASGLVRRFAHAVRAPVSAHRNGHGVMSSDDPLCVSHPVAHELWRHADVVVGLGTRLQTQQIQWGVDDDIKMIHIDIDQEAIGRICKPAVGMHADLADALPPLISALDGRRGARGDWMATVAELRNSISARIEAKLKPQLAFLRAIRDVLPRDGIFVNEITQMGYVAGFAFPSYRPRTFLSAGFQGNLGFGFPTALGAAHACRGTPVVSISGDGGLMYAIGELATAVTHDIPLKSIVFKDNAFGNVRRIQQERYGGRILGVDLDNPDFVKLARNFGVSARRARTPDQLRSALRMAIEHDGPFLIEVPVGEFASPWEFILMPTARGKRPVGREHDAMF